MSTPKARHNRNARACALLAICWAVAACSSPPADSDQTPAAIPPPKLTEAQKAQVDEITGAQGRYNADEDVHKVTFPRKEVSVTVDGWPFQPFMGITSWAAFTPLSEGEVMVMGDLTLFEDEVNPVMSVALDGGLEVTALHNHFFYDKPRVMFMHIGGRGGVDTLATAVRKALDKVAEIRTSASQPASGFGGPAIPEDSSITAETIDAILGVRGNVNNGMYKVALGRNATMHGRTVTTQMGVNTWAAFAGSDDNAFVDGDFAMHESEVQDVLKALRYSGINIVALHNHMIQARVRPPSWRGA
jgi:hypothetical protein